MIKDMQDVVIFLIGEAIFLLTVGITAYVRIMSQLREFEIRLNHVEKQDDAIIQKLDDIADNITEIKIDLTNKQNRQ